MTDDSRDERRRQRVLADYEILDGRPRRELASLVDLAAQVAGVPYAVVNVLTEEAQHQVATVGFTGAVSSRRDAMCRLVVETGQPIALADSSVDPRFADSPWTTGEIGEVRYYSSHPLRTPGGVVIGTLCVFDHESHPVTPQSERGLTQLADRVVDVLELELASRRLGEANARLSTANGRLVHFAGQVSHDLKNPLTSVSLSLETLELDITDPAQADILARARRGLDRMTGLISNLLDFASQGVDPTDDDVDLDVELDAALDDLAGRIEREQVVRRPLPRVRGDAPQLRSVLMNLVDNAAKFVHDGDHPDVEVEGSSHDTHHRVEVRDRGRGVPPHQQERVFEPLARLDKSVPGEGIGLATCRRIVEAHGGAMGVEERPGGGSVFWFELPARG